MTAWELPKMPKFWRHEEECFCFLRDGIGLIAKRGFQKSKQYNNRTPTTDNGLTKTKWKGKNTPADICATSLLPKIMHLFQEIFIQAKKWIVLHLTFRVSGVSDRNQWRSEYILSGGQRMTDNTRPTCESLNVKPATVGNWRISALRSLNMPIRHWQIFSLQSMEQACKK